MVRDFAEQHDGGTLKMPFQHMVIVGLGLVGASVAQAVRAAWPDAAIAGVDTDGRTREAALRRGMVDRAADGAGEEFAALLADGCDLVVLAVPVDVAEPYMRTIAQSGYTGVVMDTASTKARMSGTLDAATSQSPQYA